MRTRRSSSESEVAGSHHHRGEGSGRYAHVLCEHSGYATKFPALHLVLQDSGSKRERLWFTQSWSLLVPTLPALVALPIHEGTILRSWLMMFTEPPENWKKSEFRSSPRQNCVPTVPFSCLSATRTGIW